MLLCQHFLVLLTVHHLHALDTLLDQFIITLATIIHRQLLQLLPTLEQFGVSLLTLTINLPCPAILLLLLQHHQVSSHYMPKLLHLLDSQGTSLWGMVVVQGVEG